MGVPPSPATKALLDQGLNVVGRVCQSSKYKFANWNIKLPKNMTKNPESEFRKLSRAAQFFREGHYSMEDIKKIQADARLAKEAEKKAKEATKLAKESKTLWDKFLSKAKGSSLAQKAASAGGTVAKAGDTLIKFAPIITMLINIGISVVVNEIQGWRNDINEEGQQKLGDSISRVLGLMNGQKGRIDAVSASIKKAELENQRVRDRIYSLEKQQPAIKSSVADAKKKANDALYEVRAGQTKMRADIATVKKQSNDALYETRQGRIKVQAEIASVKKQTNDALYETRTVRSKIEERIASIQSQVNKFSQGVSANFQTQVTTKLASIQADVQANKNQIANLEKTKPSFDQKVLESVQNTVSKVKTDLGGAISRLIELEKLPKQFEGIAVKIVDGKIEKISTDIKDIGIKVNTKIGKDEIVREIDFNKGPIIKIIEPRIKEVLAPDIQRLYKNDEVLSGGISALSTNVDQRLKKLEQEGLRVSDPDVDGLIKSVHALKDDLDRVKVNEKKIGADIGTLTEKIKEQEKMNQQAIPKLDQILGFLPLIPARAAAAIRPSIPTIPQIETASATGTCRTLQPGGCSRKAFDDLGNGINQNTNNQSNNLFDKLNAGANAAQLGLLKVIDNKLGAQIPGGISGKLVSGFKWLRLDRALNMLTFAATVQNHVMLSNNIGETLFGALNNVFKLFGLKDDQGEDFSFSNSIGTVIKAIVGNENYTQLSETWAKANRIYQATSNVLNNFLSLSQTILQASELIAAYTGKIGNALRNSGVVLENAYGWFNPQPKFNRVTGFLDKVQTGASTIQMVTQAPLDIVNATTELTNASTELVNAVKDDGEAKNKAPVIPEPDVLKSQNAEAKKVSQPLNFNFSDLFDGED